MDEILTKLQYININDNNIKEEVKHELLQIHEKYIYLINNKEHMTELQLYRFIYRLNLYPKNIKEKENKYIWKNYINSYYEIKKNIIINFKIKNQKKCALCKNKSKIMCSCLNINYCSKKCYHLDWNEHKKDYSHKFVNKYMR